jgi:methylmalonyl-CoA mutase N-terminal domain/subunit
MAYEPELPVTDHTIYEPEQEVENVVSTVQAASRCVPHARQIRVKAPTIS